MQFLPLKSTFFPPVINRLKTSEIISVILHPWQVVARSSVPASAAAPGRHCPAPRVATTRPVPQPGCQETARNSAVHREVGFTLFKDKTKNK